MAGFVSVAIAYTKHFFSTNTTITDQAFKLHHQVTTPVLMTLALATAVSEITSSMSCFADAGDLSEELLNTYCWMQNTFIMPDALSGKTVGLDVPHPVMDGHVEGETRQQFQRYYQWIPYILFVQAILFYLPYMIWKSMESNRIKRLLIQQEKFIVAASENMLPLPADVENDKRGDTNRHRLLALADYLAESWNRSFSCLLPVVYFLCVVLALVNVVLQLYFVDSFTNHEFSRLNWGLMGAVHNDVAKRNDSLLTVFPRMTKCRYRQYGAAGSVVLIDAVCVMPFNMFFERVFVYSWFWFLILAVLCTAQCIFCLLNLTVRRIRHFTLQRYSHMVEMKLINEVLSSRSSNVGDWFMLLLIDWNIHPERFSHLMKLLKSKGERKAA